MHVVRPPADTTSARASFTCLRERHSPCKPWLSYWHAIYTILVIWASVLPAVDVACPKYCAVP